MTDTNSVWLKTPAQKLQALLADEAKSIKMIEGITDAARQLLAKSRFRIALLNQLIEDGEAMDKRLDHVENKINNLKENK